MTSGLAGMKLLIASDIRMVRDGERALTTHPAGSYESFRPLAENFSSAAVISRGTDLAGAAGAGETAEMTGPGLTHEPVPDYHSAVELASALPRTFVAVWRAVGRSDVVFIRLPEPLSILVGIVAVLRRRKILSNVVADPSTLPFARFRNVVRGILTLLTRFVVKRSTAVVYVTRETLQKKFPSAEGTPMLARSNVRLSAISDQARELRSGQAPVTLICVGTNSGLVKGQDLLVEAVAELVDEGMDLRLDLVGGGNRSEWLSERATELAIRDRVVLHGHVDDPEAVQSLLRQAHLFCLPSRSEGLPRAMIEAMALGIPAIGSEAGGIPEILPREQVVSEFTAAAVARAVRSLLGSGERYVRASRDGLAVAREIYDGTDPARFQTFLREALG